MSLAAVDLSVKDSSRFSGLEKPERRRLLRGIVALAVVDPLSLNCISPPASGTFEYFTLEKGVRPGQWRNRLKYGCTYTSML